MTFTINLASAIALVLSIINILVVGVSIVMFLGKLKWDTNHLTSRLDALEADVKSLKGLMEVNKDQHSKEQMALLDKLAGVDKSVGLLAEALSYVKLTVDDVAKEIKEHMRASVS